MAELAVIMSMIRVTSTAASLFAVVKARCGASQAITVLAKKCSEHMDRIRELLTVLKRFFRVPNDAHGILSIFNMLHLSSI